MQRSHVLEPQSVTDARARLGTRTAVAPRRGHLRKSLVGLPLALVAGDLVAVGVESALVRPRGYDTVLFAIMVLAARGALRHYRPRLHLAVLDDLPRLLAATVAALGLSFIVLQLVNDPTATPERELLERGLCFFAVAVVVETVAFTLVRRNRRRGPGRRTLIVGAGRVGTVISDALQEHPELGLDPVGFADPDASGDFGVPSLPMFTTDMSQLARTIIDNDIDTTILAFTGEGSEHVDTVIELHQTGCAILMVPSMFELHRDGPDVERVRGVPLLRLRPDPTLRPSWWIKRAVDVLAGVLGLVVLALPLAFVALIILVGTGRPLLFWQERVGLDGTRFRLCKFRSMRPLNEQESQTTWTIANDPRVGRIGKLLRRSSIDEIPQLWNIARGQMSLVGPRPERPTFVQKFSEEHDLYWARHRVPVGLTGLAQVSGLRGDTSIRERARYDNYYIANWSLWLDMKIILLTAREVFGGRGR